MKQSLENVQRWMQAVITHPAGVEAGLESDAAQGHLGVTPGAVEDVINASPSQTSVERLAIYSTAYYARLMECLEAEFPVFKQAAGEEAFADFGFQYLQRYPSQSYTLGELGNRFCRFLEETKPAQTEEEHDPFIPALSRSATADLQHGESLTQREREKYVWPDFLIDLARLERTFSEVFDGPGVEGKSLVTAAELAAISSDEWSEAKLETVPCLRLLKLRFPLNDYYTAAKQGSSPEIPAAADSWVVVTRRDYIVRRYELNRPQFLLLEALQRGASVGEAIAIAAEVYQGTAEQLAADLREWFTVWAAAPLFEKIVLESE